jgi:transcriptional regulator with XRE-family HTH domain
MTDAPITGEQVEAARKLLGWSRARLAAFVGVSEHVIANFEQKGYLSSVLKTYRLRKAFEDAGVEFSPDGPPRLRVKRAAWESPPNRE